MFNSSEELRMKYLHINVWTSMPNETKTTQNKSQNKLSVADFLASVFLER